MELGAFSISLAVKDLEASRSFYEKFGFKVFAGEASQNWLILKNRDHVIGLFQGMFDRNILILRRLAGRENWLAVLKECPVSPDDVPPGRRAPARRRKL